MPTCARRGVHVLGPRPAISQWLPVPCSGACHMPRPLEPQEPADSTGRASGGYSVPRWHQRVRGSDNERKQSHATCDAQKPRSDDSSCWYTPPVGLGVTSLATTTCGGAGGRIGPTRCAGLDAARGASGRTPKRHARRSPPDAPPGAAVWQRQGRRHRLPPRGGHCARTSPRSGATPGDEARPPRDAPGTRPGPLHPGRCGSGLQGTCPL